jgi:hypothetical protein
MSPFSPLQTSGERGRQSQSLQVVGKIDVEHQRHLSLNLVIIV